ncbi:MAG TPA: UPF0182 family protein [Gemmatimonadales bacterium]|nr:UPF0182 family protein [Gemmatimonadales bacterium]
MTRTNRRRLYLISAGLLVAALVGGRWLAVETAERAWDRTFAGGEALIAVRDLSRLLQVLVLLVAVVWITGNLLIVYRAIGSVHMPRRLGDLEIVEAVPRRTLLIGTILAGVVFGTLLALGTGEWWRDAVLAASPPHFGVSDSTRLGYDAGYYLSVLPWLDALQNRTLILVVAALGIVALLYAVIGSLRIRRGRIRASNYARAHVGVLLACLALTIAWGAVLDPAEIVGGFHGPVDQAALLVRMPGARVVAGVAIIAMMISLVWAWRDRPNIIIAGWAALLVSITAGYFVIPGFVRASAGADSAELRSRRAALERIAFGVGDVDSTSPPPFASGEVAVRTIPLWDPAHVAMVAAAPGQAVALRSPRGEERGAVWMIAPTNSPAPIRLAVETDSGLALTPLPLATTRLLFGPGLLGSMIMSADSVPTPRRGGASTGAIPLTGVWRRFAIAWTTQDWSLARGGGDSGGRRLLWRRDMLDRLERLAPFARFGTPAPLLRDGSLWWVSWGYVAHESFPLARPLPWREAETRFLRAGLVGAVSVATGETHLWLAPGYDSLTAAWARRFTPLIEPADRLPADVRAQLSYPVETFRIAVQQLIRVSSDSVVQAEWSARPREPFQLGAPSREGGSVGTVWTGIALESGSFTPKRFVGLLAGAITARGQELHLWRPSPANPERLPGELVGSTLLRPGQLRVWPAGNSIITVQAQLLDPVGLQPRPAPHVMEVYVTHDGRGGRGLTARSALLGGEQLVTDTTLAARWDRVHRLAIRADSALSAGDLEKFGSLWRQLMAELAQVHPPR